MGELGMGWIDSQGIRAAGDPGTIWSTLLPHRCGNQAQEAEVLAWAPGWAAEEWTPGTLGSVWGRWGAWNQEPSTVLVGPHARERLVDLSLKTVSSWA